MARSTEMPDAAGRKVHQYLLEAHASELALAHVLTAHIAMTPEGDYRDGLEQHLAETKDHALRIEEHLASREGGRPGPLLVGFGLAQAVAGQVVAMTLFPLNLVRGASASEKLLKNAKDELASEALEIATYLAIEELAHAVGDSDTVELARSIRADEERMQQRLTDLLPSLVDDVVSAEIDGESRFAIGQVGAVQAAKYVARTLTGAGSPRNVPVTRRQGRTAAPGKTTGASSRSRSTTSGGTASAKSRTTSGSVKGKSRAKAGAAKRSGAGGARTRPR